MFKEKWTLEKVRFGFDKFYELYSRYPTAYDVDDFDFLPSSRQIQRRFGGLLNLRKELGLKIENYSRGEERSKIALRVNKEGKNCESTVFDLLKLSFDEKFIHIEKPISSDYKNRCDFYVFAKPENFLIDVFSTNDVRNLVKIMNIKEKSYGKADIKENLYFVYFGEVDKAKMSQWLLNKRIKIPSNWIIICFNDFKREVLKYSSYNAI